MKAKIRKHNLDAGMLARLDGAAREYFDERVEEYSRRLQECFAKRWLAATMLAANDQHYFGAVRGKRLVDGIIEVIQGNCEDVYSKDEIDKPGADKAYKNMVDELADRGIKLVITVNGLDVRAEVETMKNKKKTP